MFLTSVLLLLLCLGSSKAMEDYELNQERLCAATFAFVENYVKSRNDQSGKRMHVPARMFQYIPEKIPPLSPQAICLINMETADEIARFLKIIT